MEDRMANRAPFLKTRFGGYYHRAVPQEDTELTHVGPDTPCGEYMRRFWQPVCFLGRSARSAVAGQNLGRGSRRVSRPERNRRPAGIALPAPRHLARIRAGRRQGDTLLLPWLVVRRGWDHPGDPGRACRQHLEGQAL